MAIKIICVGSIPNPGEAFSNNLSGGKHLSAFDATGANLPITCRLRRATSGSN